MVLCRPFDPMGLAGSAGSREAGFRSFSDVRSFPAVCIPCVGVAALAAASGRLGDAVRNPGGGNSDWGRAPVKLQRRAIDLAPGTVRGKVRPHLEGPGTESYRIVNNNARCSANFVPLSDAEDLRNRLGTAFCSGIGN